MKIAVKTNIPNLEASFIASLFPTYSVNMILPWDFRLNETYDVAFCVGPTGGLINADFKVLMVFGDSSVYQDDGYHAIVTTNKKAMQNCQKRFGGSKKYFTISPPVLNIEAGSRRIAKKKVFYTTYSNNPDLYFPIKGLNVIYRNWAGDSNFPLFSVNDFNTYIRNGAIGYYDGSTDGYDSQVRRHLALGGRVVIEDPDEEILGDLIKYIDKDIDLSKPIPKKLKNKINKVDCIGSEGEYGKKIKNLLFSI